MQTYIFISFEKKGKIDSHDSNFYSIYFLLLFIFLQVGAVKKKKRSHSKTWVKSPTFQENWIAEEKEAKFLIQNFYHKQFYLDNICVNFNFKIVFIFLIKNCFNFSWLN